jgi:hypothetical protein
MYIKNRYNCNLNEFFIQDIQKIRKELLEKLTDHADNKRINTKKYVIYDPNKEEILSMPCIEVGDDGKTYKLNII